MPETPGKSAQQAADTPTPGRRTGEGSESILPFLTQSLATRPQGPAIGKVQESASPTEPETRVAQDSAAQEWIAERDRLLVLEKLLAAAVELSERGGPQPTELILEVSRLRTRVNHLFARVQEETRRKQGKR